MNCQICEEDVKELFPMKYSRGDKLMICQECVDKEESRADMLYEMMREQEFEQRKEAKNEGKV